MAAPNSSTSNQAVVDTKFCINSTTTFVVRKKPPVASHVGGRWIIQELPLEEPVFELKELPLKERGLALKEPGLALKEPGLALKDSKGKLILTVKPEDTMLDMILNFFGQDTLLRVKKQWNVFLAMERLSSNGTLLPVKKLFTVDTSGVNWNIEVPGTDYKFEGSFVDRGNSQSPIFKIFDISQSPIIAAEVKLDNQVKLNNQVDNTEIYSVYNVEVKTGYDQAFIFGLVAVFEQIRPFSNIH